MLGGTNTTKAAEDHWGGHGLDGFDLRTGIHIYTTGPQGGARGLNPHTDPYDVFILQLEGSKKWTVCTPPAPRSYNGTADGLSSAEKAELHLQDQHKSGQCTFYTDESLKELDCSQFVLEAGDTYYMPKGLVHYAESTGATAMHATISLDRTHATWFDLVLDELRRKQVVGGSLLTWNADVLAQHVQSTRLGVRLAQLVPVGAVRLLPGSRGNLDTTNSLALEPALRQYLHALVTEVVGRRQAQSNNGRHDVAAGHTDRYRRAFRWLNSDGGGGDRRVAVRMEELKGVGTGRKGRNEHVARERRGGTDHGSVFCDAGCDEACPLGSLFGFICNDGCDSSCACNPGYEGIGRYCASCARDTYKSSSGDGQCVPHITCGSGDYRSGASPTRRGACTPCPIGQFSVSANVNRCTPCPPLQCDSSTQYQVGDCGGSANTKQCIDCNNAVCPANQYRSGTCDRSGNGFQCNPCDNLDCSAQGDHLYRAGTCGGTTNGYTCDKHEPCPDIDTFYLPSDDTHRTCPPCPAGQHQPFANHRVLECIDTTTTTTTSTSSTTTATATATTTTSISTTTTSATIPAYTGSIKVTPTFATNTTTVPVTTPSAVITTLNTSNTLNQDLESKSESTKKISITTFVVVVVGILLLTVIGLIAHAKRKRRRRQPEQAGPLGPQAMRATTVANAGFRGMPAPAPPLEEPYGAHCDDAGARDDGIGDGKCDGHGDGDGYIHVEGANSANANVTGTLQRVQQQHVPYGGAEGHVRQGGMQQSACAPRLINDAGVYLQSSSEQAVLYDTGDVPGIAGNQLPVYVEVDDDQDPDRGAAQVNATLQRCKYRQAGAGGQRCKAKTSTEWCEKHTCSTPACKNSKASKDVVCLRCPERAEAGGVMYAARNDGTLRVGADGGMFYATRNDGNRPSTGANAAGGGIKRNGNRKGSVYLGFEEGGETSTL